jgi:hypothetical protein
VSSKRTAAETRRHIADLEAEIKILRSREADPIEGYAAELRDWIKVIPSRQRYVGEPAPSPRDDFEAALLDMEAEHWDAHAVTAVFALCERCGVRPRSRSPQDIEEAAESILLKYPR